VPKYELSATIDPDLIEGEIESVTWRLPRSDFERPGSKGRGASANINEHEFEVKEVGTDFKLQILAWKPFELQADIQRKGKPSLHLRKLIDPTPNE